MKPCCKTLLKKELKKLAVNFDSQGLWHFGVHDKTHGGDVSQRIYRLIKEIG